MAIDDAMTDTVGELVPKLVAAIKRHPRQSLRGYLVEAVIAALIEETDPGIAVFAVPCGDAAVRAALLAVKPVGRG